MPGISKKSGLFWLGLIVLLILALVFFPQGSPSNETLPYSEFREKVEAGSVETAKIRGQEIAGKYTSGSKYRTTGPADTTDEINMLREYGVAVDFEEVAQESEWVSLIFIILPLVLMVVLFLWFMRNLQGNQGRAMSFGKSRAKMLNDTGKRITFDDVAGIEEAKEELAEIVEFLRDPRRFTRLGGRIPKGVLLTGPPGTGKTLLARAVAGEAGVPFFSISGSDFVEMFVGVGASRVRDLFEQGKKQSPCIIFVDEIDAVGRHRGSGLGGGHDEREQTLNALLVEMDGFEGTEGVIIVAATNRPDVLDSALLRPGRFDRQVVVPAPDVRGREKILEIHARRLPKGDDVDLAVVAKGTPGFSGAELENLCNEAALLAARANKRQVDMIDFKNAREKILMGPERRSMYMPERERRNTAYHEAGHALIAHLLPGHDPVHKVTIVPRGRALGVTMYLPDEDRLSQTRADLIKKITSAMGGRAAEEVGMNEVTGGAAHDLVQATRIARTMVCDLGMSSDLGPVAWSGRTRDPFRAGMTGQGSEYSEQTARFIDAEVKTLLQRSYDTAVEMLTENIHVLHRVAQTLMENESLDGDEFAKLVEESSPVYPKTLAWMM